MLSLFRNKLVSAIVWVVVFALAIQLLQLFFMPAPGAIYHTSPLVGYWIDSLQTFEYGNWIAAGIVFLATLIAGFSFTYLLNDREILFRATFLPALFYFYFCHIFSEQNLITPHFIANIFILIVISRYLSLDARDMHNTLFLDIGFFSSCAFCISPDMLLFLPAVLLSLIFSAYINVKTFSLLLTGFLLPIYFTGLGFFLADDLDSFYRLFDTDIFTADLTRYNLDIYQIILLSLTFIILLISLLGLQANYFRNTIRARRAQQMLLLFFISGVLVILFSKAPVSQTFTLLSLPLCAFVSYYFLKTKRPAVRESLFVIFLILIIIASATKLFYIDGGGF